MTRLIDLFSAIYRVIHLWRLGYYPKVLPE
jgi:hypothetical protein